MCILSLNIKDLEDSESGQDWNYTAIFLNSVESEYTESNVRVDIEGGKEMKMEFKD